MRFTSENSLDTKTFFWINKGNPGKMFIIFLAITFYFTSVQAMQTINGKPRKKSIVKHKKYKENVKKRNYKIFPCECINCSRCGNPRNLIKDKPDN